MSVKVGTFAKSTNTSVPVDQAVTGVGFTPKALILWTTGQTSANSYAEHYRYAVGFTTGASESGSIALASQDDVGTTNSSKRPAAKALTIVEWAEATLAECDLKTFDADGFTLTWTTNNASAYIIHYIALGGAEVTNAKVVNWETTSTGNKGVTGVGFQPTVVLHICSRATTKGTSATSADFGFGVMTAADQGAIAHYDPDGQATSGLVSGSSHTAQAIALYSTAIAIKATYVSMDADGFTVNFANITSGAEIFSLCLNIAKYDLGYFTHDASGSKSVTGVGFKPQGVLLFTKSVASTPTAYDGATDAFSIGAGDGTTQTAGMLFAEINVDPTQTMSESANNAVILATDDSSGVDKIAALTSRDADGFTVNFGTWDTGTILVHYLALLEDTTSSAVNWQHYAAQMGRVM